MKEKLNKIKCIIFDIDGVFTQGDIIYGKSDELKVFNVQDGMGITLARNSGYLTGIITGRKSDAVERRAKGLKFDVYYQGKADKRQAYKEIKEKFKLKNENIAYMGDDLLDLCLLLQVGFSIAPANAREEVKDNVDLVTKAIGGNGAVREAIEYILKETGKWNEIVKNYMKI